MLYEVITNTEDIQLINEIQEQKTVPSSITVSVPQRREFEEVIERRVT